MHWAKQVFNKIFYFLKGQEAFWECQQGEQSGKKLLPQKPAKTQGLERGKTRVQRRTCRIKYRGWGGISGDYHGREIERVALNARQFGVWLSHGDIFRSEEDTRKTFNWNDSRASFFHYCLLRNVITFPENIWQWTWNLTMTHLIRKTSNVKWRSLSRGDLNTIRGCDERRKKKRMGEIWLNGSTPPSCQSSILGKGPGRVIS